MTATAPRSLSPATLVPPSTIGLPVDAALAPILHRQEGILSRSQALAAGMTRRQVDYRIQRGSWRIYSPGVYLLATARLTLTGRRFAALLHCGPNAYLSHWSAAHLLGMDSWPERGPVCVTVPHDARVRVDSRIRLRRTRIMPGTLAVDGGLIVSSPVRTLIDLAAVKSPRDLRSTLHDAVFKHIVTSDDLYAALAEPSRLPGYRAFRNAVLAYDPNSDSGTEVEAEHLFRRHGMVFVRRHTVRDARRKAVLDFADLGRMLDIEVDGAAYHADPRAQERDRARDRWLTGLGWQVLRIAVQDLRDRPEEIVAQVRAALAQRVDRAGSSAHIPRG